MKPTSWNTLARKHYRVYMRAASDWRLATIEALGRRTARFSGPVHVIVTPSWKLKGKRRHDLDNVFLKPVLDTLVEKGVLPDDESQNVARLTIECPNGEDKDFLRIEIIPYA